MSGGHVAVSVSGYPFLGESWVQLRQVHEVCNQSLEPARSVATKGPSQLLDDLGGAARFCR